MLPDLDELLGEDGEGRLVPGLGGFLDLHLQLLFFSLEFAPVSFNIPSHLPKLPVVGPDSFCRKSVTALATKLTLVEE